MNKQDVNSCRPWLLYLQYAESPWPGFWVWWYTSGKNFWRKAGMLVTPPVIPLSNCSIDLKLRANIKESSQALHASISNRV